MQVDSKYKKHWCPQNTDAARGCTLLCALPATSRRICGLRFCA